MIPASLDDLIVMYERLLREAGLSESERVLLKGVLIDIRYVKGVNDGKA